MRTISVLHYPYVGTNPYQAEMISALRVHGIEANPVQDKLLSLLSCVLNSKADILHLHWIDGPIKFINPLGALTRAFLFYLCLGTWKLRRKKIAWTVHNLKNHEGRRPKIDHLHSKFVAKASDLVLVHGPSAVKVVQDALQVPANKISVVMHGNYSNLLKRNPSLSKPDTCRFLFFGNIREYKGVPELLEVFCRLPEGPELKIVGKVESEKLKDEILETAASNSRITLHLDYVSDEILEQFLGWSSLVVLPYKDVFTSGSLLMALSAGRPVIAPDIGLIPDYVDAGSAFLYAANDKLGLYSAMLEASRSENLQKMQKTALDQAANFDWGKVAESLVSAYASLPS